jgi:hypothetical protein
LRAWAERFDEVGFRSSLEASIAATVRDHAARAMTPGARMSAA